MNSGPWCDKDGQVKAQQRWAGQGQRWVDEHSITWSGIYGIAWHEAGGMPEKPESTISRAAHRTVTVVSCMSTTIFVKLSTLHGMVRLIPVPYHEP
jgi:hypothetical protein